MSYTPPDAHNIKLDFEQLITPVDSHNLVINFGDVEPRSSVLNALVDTHIQAFIQGLNTEIVINHGDFLATINTNIQAEIRGANWQNIDNRGTLLTVIDTSIQASVSGINDINHIRGIAAYWGGKFQRAIPCLTASQIPWSKSILRVSNEALFFGSGLLITTNHAIKFEEANSLSTAVRLMHEQATGLSSQLYFDWNKNKRLQVTQSSVFEQADKLYIERAFDWVELVRKRKQVSYSHKVAHEFEKRFSFEWDKGLQITTDTALPWDKAKAIHYRKHAVDPWPQPELPEYTGSTDLNFICLCHDVDSHNIVLNFGADDCIPAIPNQKGWYILNTVNVVRLDTGQSIKVLDGSYNTSRDNWCWSYSLTVPPTEISKLVSDGNPVILQITVNDNVHQMLYESKSVSRQFAKETWTLKGRSQSALLSADYSSLRSFLQENERTSVQLCQAEIDRVNSNTLLDWQLIDELGWIVENESLTYTNLAPIDAIKMIAEAGGGFIYSELSGNQITIRPKYKKSVWDAMSINDYDKLLPQSLVLDHSIDEVEMDGFNGITLTNAKNGNTFQVKRTGTAGDVLKETVSNAMFDAVSAGGYAKTELSRFGKVEDHSFTTPMNSHFNECVPGETLAFNGNWWGIVDAVDVSFSYKEVKQTIKVERVLNEQ